jgi:hypothetical protein
MIRDDDLRSTLFNFVARRGGSGNKEANNVERVIYLTPITKVILKLPTSMGILNGNR